MTEIVFCFNEMQIIEVTGQTVCLFVSVFLSGCRSVCLFVCHLLGTWLSPQICQMASNRNFELANSCSRSSSTSNQIGQVAWASSGYPISLERERERALHHMCHNGNHNNASGKEGCRGRGWGRGSDDCTQQWGKVILDSGRQNSGNTNMKVN